MVISYRFRGFEVFLMIIIRFGENNVLGTIYINFGGGWRGILST